MNTYNTDKIIDKLNPEEYTSTPLDKPEWQREFISTFYVYNLKKGPPAGAEKEAVDFILCKKQQWEADARREGYTDGFGAGLQVCTGDMKCTCGEPKL